VPKAIAIESFALISPLGANPEETWRAIHAGRRLADRGIISEPTFNQIASDVPSEIKNLDRSIVLAWAACTQAISRAGWRQDQLRDPDTALFMATSKGPVLAVLSGCEVLHKSGPAGLSEQLAEEIALGPGAAGTLVAWALGVGGPIHTSVAACAGSLAAVHLACRALMTGQCRRAIIAATDASVHPMFENSFNNLGVLPSPAADARRYCEPFTAGGGGFFITEGAAALCLSLSENPRLRVEKTWLGGDATHLIATDPAGRSLSRGLKFCSQGFGVDFVHAHATGTEHDKFELAAIQRICGTQVNVFSHKFWMGHTLGASGLMALVLSAMCHLQGATLGGAKLDAKTRSITVAQGFGGHIGVCALASG